MLRCVVCSRRWARPGKFAIEIVDEGPGYRPEDIPDPTDPENLDRPCGRGLLLMRHYMTEMAVLPPGNVCRCRTPMTS